MAASASLILKRTPKRLYVHSVPISDAKGYEGLAIAEYSACGSPKLIFNATKSDGTINNGPNANPVICANAEAASGSKSNKPEEICNARLDTFATGLCQSHATANAPKTRS